MEQTEKFRRGVDFCGKVFQAYSERQNQKDKEAERLQKLMEGAQRNVSIR